MVDEKPKLAVPYLRVSTADKEQNPKRQLDLIRAWAERENVVLLREVVDEGTSATKTNPWQRPRFVEAVENATRAGAAAIVVEIVDRFCGQGSDEYGWAKVELRHRAGLQLWTADIPLEVQGTLSGNVMAAAKAEVRREWAALHSRRVSSGMATKKREGKRVGGAPPKPLSEEEMDLAVQLRLTPSRGGHPTGWPTIALEISRRRGALEIASVASRRQRAVTANHVQRLVEEELERRGIRPPATPWSRGARKNESTQDAAGVA